MDGRFLSLPREIRDQIYEAYIDLPFEGPTPSTANFWNITETLLVPDHFPQPNLHDVNRQISVELLEAINSHSARNDFTYRLSLSLFGEDPQTNEPEQLIPVWTNMPPTAAASAKCLYISLHVYQVECQPFSETRRQSLLNIIYRFFAHGPSLHHDHRTTFPSGFFVEELVIDLMPAKEPPSISATDLMPMCELLARESYLEKISLRKSLAGESLSLEKHVGRIVLKEHGEMQKGWFIKKGYAYPTHIWIELGRKPGKTSSMITQGSW